MTHSDEQKSIGKQSQNMCSYNKYKTIRLRILMMYGSGRIVFIDPVLSCKMTRNQRIPIVIPILSQRLFIIKRIYDE